MKASGIKIIKRADANKLSVAEQKTESSMRREMNEGRRQLTVAVKDWIGEWREEKKKNAERERVIFWGAALNGLQEENA